MARTRPAPKALVFYGFTAPRQETALFQEVETRLTARHGEVLTRLQPFSFSDLTSYYETEMGPDLLKTFILFKEPISLEDTASLKTHSNGLEGDYKKQDHPSNRRINIDPGVLTLYNFCLLTAKGFSHRVYLRDGIYAEVTLRASEGRFRPLEWTYRDYKTPEALEFLEEGRRHLKARTDP